MCALSTGAAQFFGITFFLQALHPLILAGLSRCLSASLLEGTCSLPSILHEKHLFGGTPLHFHQELEDGHGVLMSICAPRFLPNDSY